MSRTLSLGRIRPPHKGANGAVDTCQGYDPLGWAICQLCTPATEQIKPIGPQSDDFVQHTNKVAAKER